MEKRFTTRGAMVAAFLAFQGRALADTYVTTYVVRVQEERERTRWTLTEWLRIKERMRMMDLWLAMFSDPKKDHFRPELNLVYGMTRGDLRLTDAAGLDERASTSGAQGRAQLWLTNILTGTVGVRALNIDFGIEGFARSMGGFEPAQPQQAAQEATATATTAATPADGTQEEGTPTSRLMRHSYGAANLRIFGKSIQDSSLIVKYGQYTSKNSVPTWAEADAGRGDIKGAVAGAEAQFYLFKWLGFEGNYLAYGDASGPSGSELVSGSYADYAGFVEISLLRLMVGQYREDWAFDNGGNPTKSTEQGTLAGVKLQF
jgi:hypothetical protein